MYVINSKYIEGKIAVTLKISLEHSKITMCHYKFITWGNSLIGSPLTTGIKLKNIKTNGLTIFNLHHPKQIRTFILYALDNGWTGESSIDFPDGLIIMNKMGFDVSVLQEDIELKEKQSLMKEKSWLSVFQKE